MSGVELLTTDILTKILKAIWPVLNLVKSKKIQLASL